MFTDREIFLMRESLKAGAYYSDLHTWLNEIISDSGHIVEQALDHGADEYAKRQKPQVSPKVNI